MFLAPLSSYQFECGRLKNVVIDFFVLVIFTVSPMIYYQTCSTTYSKDLALPHYLIALLLLLNLFINSLT